MTDPNQALAITGAQVVLEGVQFRHRADFLARTEESAPPAPADVQVQVVMGEGNKSAVVKTTVSGQSAEAFYVYSATYVTILALGDGAKPENLNDRLAVTGATMAYPFLRELLANLSSRGRFGAVWLAPINFDQLVRGRRKLTAPPISSPPS